MKFVYQKIDSQGYPHKYEGECTHTNQIIAKANEHFGSFDIKNVRILDFEKSEIKNIEEDFKHLIPNGI